SIPLVYSSSGCFEGTDQFINEEAACERGIKEKYVQETNNLSVIFSSCIEVGYIILIVAIVIVFVAIALTVYFMPKRVMTRERQEINLNETEMMQEKMENLDDEMDKVRDRANSMKRKVEALKNSQIHIMKLELFSTTVNGIGT